MRCATPGFPVARTLLLLAALCAISAVKAAGNDCPAILPAGVVANGELRLCRTGAAVGNGISVCREYGDGQRIYQVVFQGGVSPVAVYTRARTTLRVKERVADGARRPIGNRRCDLERPAGVPAAALYRGTGVCEDEHGRPLPCSLFEHAGARIPEAMRYFVYYEPDGGGVRRVDVQTAGHNLRALEAELAFQLGQALTSADCCRERARHYIAYAAALFPVDNEYRRALHAHSSLQTEQDVTAEPDCTSGTAATQSATQSNP